MRRAGGRTIALRAERPDASLRELAGELGVNQSTVSRRMRETSTVDNSRITQSQRAAKAGVSRATQATIDAVRRIDPILADRVEAGEVAAKTAARKVGVVKERTALDDLS